MTEIVTPNEIAARLGVTGLAFRTWLRWQKASGHPLVASHAYRTRYAFARPEADQLTAEFAGQILGPRASACSLSSTCSAYQAMSPAKRSAAAGI